MVTKITILEVLEPFLSKPREELHISAIAKETRGPHPTARKRLNALERIGVLKKGKKGRLTIYSLNMEHPNIADYLVIAEKARLIKRCESDLILKEFVHFLNVILEENSKALIFGSATKSAGVAEDIDLLVVGKISASTIETFSRKFKKEIHLISVNSLGKISQSLKTEIIKKHLIIKGSEDIVGWMIR